MKKIFYLLICIGSCLFVTNVSAKEVYYQNDNGVTFSKEEYDYLTYMYWDGAQDLMTKEDYEKFINYGIVGGSLNSVIYDEPILTRGATYETASKKLKISSSCSTNCAISIVATWKNSPAVRSYDVIGAYLENTTLKDTPVTKVTSSTGAYQSTEIKSSSNGFGVSVSLPAYGTSVIISQTFKVASGGTVYGSYQHAIKTISLANSKNYTISKDGYGDVFKFSGTAASTYDKMQGVNLSV